MNTYWNINIVATDILFIIYKEYNMLDNKINNISWTSFCQAMNSIAFWLIQNKKKYKKRDYYQIINIKR